MSVAGPSAPLNANAKANGSPARIFLVTRRFWPLCDDAAGRLAILAEGLRRCGFRPTIVAARYSNAWPIEFSFREIDVLRPVMAPKSDWTTGLYLRGLSRWLRDNSNAYDLLYADCMREEGAAVVETAEHLNFSSVVRCSGSGQGADWSYAASSRTARKAFNGALRADAIIASMSSVNRALVAAGAEREKIHRIADGIPPVVRRERADQLAARAALAAANSDLRVPGNCRVILVYGKFDSEHATMFAARSLAPLCQSDHDVRLWFIGDGPQRDALHEYFLQMGIRALVAMPGSFWHVDELIRAADIAVFPADCDWLEHRLPHVISGAVPVVVGELAEIKSYFAESSESPAQVQRFRSNNEESLRNAVMKMLDNFEAAQKSAIELRSVMRRSSSREHSVDAHCRLFAKLLGNGFASGFANGFANGTMATGFEASAEMGRSEELQQVRERSEGRGAGEKGSAS